MRKRVFKSGALFSALAFIFIAASAAFTACKNEEKKGLSTGLVSSDKKPEMTFSETKFDFGTMQEGEVVSHVFEFRNTGEGDLIISEAVTSCGCTVPEYPKEPIAPGKTGAIRVKFDSHGKEGQETKTISIIANTEPASNNISITANIIKK